jgi:hypothetical protein
MHGPADPTPTQDVAHILDCADADSLVLIDELVGGLKMLLSTPPPPPQGASLTRRAPPPLPSSLPSTSTFTHPPPFPFLVLVGELVGAAAGVVVQRHAQPSQEPSSTHPHNRHHHNSIVCGNTGQPWPAAASWGEILGSSILGHLGAASFGISLNRERPCTSRRGAYLLPPPQGRATSTTDGVAISWAVAEALLQRGAPTLLATHFAQLRGLAAAYPAAKLWRMRVGQGPKLRGLAAAY